MSVIDQIIRYFKDEKLTIAQLYYLASEGFYQDEDLLKNYDNKNNDMENNYADYDDDYYYSDCDRYGRSVYEDYDYDDDYDDDSDSWSPLDDVDWWEDDGEGCEYVSEKAMLKRSRIRDMKTSTTIKIRKKVRALAKAKRNKFR